MVQLQTYTNAVKVMPSDYCNIPNPSLLLIQGTVLSQPGANQFDAIGVDFIAVGVQVGDIVYFTAGGGLTDNGATVTAVVNSTTLEVNNFPLGYADSFSVYAGDQNDASKSGCVLLFPSGSTPSGTILTKAGQTISLSAFATLTYSPYVFPIQVVRYNFGGDREAIALW